MINQSQGLNTLMNNKDIYKNVLKRFFNKYKDHYIVLNNLLREEDYDSLYREIHNIKGLSLNLGASRLYSLSSILNEQYKVEKLVDKKVLKDFLIELNDCILEINDILKEMEN